MKTFRKTLFAVALTAGIFTSFPALAENCVKPNLGGLTHRQKTENYPEMVDCAYRNVLAAKNAEGNWVYLDNKTGKVLFSVPKSLTNKALGDVLCLFCAKVSIHKAFGIILG